MFLAALKASERALLIMIPWGRLPSRIDWQKPTKRVDYRPGHGPSSGKARRNVKRHVAG